MRALVVLVVVTGGGAALPGPAVAGSGPWVWPLEGPPELSRPFTAPPTRYGSGHRGVDLASAPGAAVRAAGGGRVSYAGLLAGRGVVVVVHGALRTTYEPVAATVAVGARVSAGQVVGHLQAAHAGCPVQACLHWGLRRGEDYLDPVRLVQRGPVRLLPTEEGPGSWTASGTGRDTHAVPQTHAAQDSAAAQLSRAAQEPAAAQGPARDAQPARDARPPREERPTWALQAADAPLGAAAVAALVAGIGLLARPRPSPEDPPAAAGAGTALAVPVEPAAPAAPVLELASERERRRTG